MTSKLVTTHEKPNTDNESEVKDYSIEGENIKLEQRGDVWLPLRPTMRFIATVQNILHQKGFIEGKRILEIGTGSGVVGIFLLKKGAEYVAMTDVNYAAIETTVNNLSSNGLDNGDYQYAVIDTDRFMGIQEQFDTIISNPPVQPSNPHAHINDIAAKYNENGDGRMVLDSLIKYGRSYLVQGGKLITSCSTRHGHKETMELFNTYWGKDNLQVILEDEYEIDPAYHGPYMDYWIEQQNQDGDLRVYCKDEQGNPYAPDHYDPALKWYFKYIMIEATNTSNSSNEA